MSALLSTAARLSVLAAAAYGTEADAQDACDQLRLWKPLILRNGDSYAILAYDYGEAYIAIRGTDSKYDWLDNCRTKRIYITKAGPYSQIQAHAGFIRHAKLVRDELDQQDARTLIGRHDLYLTGHSLGGAVATLLPLVCGWMAPERLVTFGAPRCLGYESAGMYPFDCTRFVGATDIVPLMPLRFRYAHVGGVRYLNGGLFAERRWGAIGKYVRIAHTYMLRSLGYRLPDVVRKQHSMERYKRALEVFA